MRRTVLITSVYFPPSALSGPKRLLAFAKYLPEYGWDTTVLTANPRVYEAVDPASVRLIPDSCEVHRTFALDVKRQLGIRGRYPSILARPDRWASWIPSAVLRGLLLIKQRNVRAILSSYPAMTSHCVAHWLNRLTGVPWIADFRDPVTGVDNVLAPNILRSRLCWEERTLRRAARIIFTTAGAARSCAERHPETGGPNRISVIANGYDDDAFSDVPEQPVRAGNGRPLVLVHSGLLYPEGRNPVPFLTALAQLAAAGDANARAVRVVLRASGSEQRYADAISRLGIESIVSLGPRISGRDALIEQAQADGLLLFQGPQYDHQIPAKVYEYMRIGRPVFALVGENGDTAALLRSTGGAEIVPIDDVSTIQTRLHAFIGTLRNGTAPHVEPSVAAQFSRRAQTGKLAELLGQMESRMQRQGSHIGSGI